MNPAERPEPAAASAEVLEIVAALVRELQPQRRDLRPSLDSSLERDLGLDSLGRVELVHRLERAFGTRLPETALTQAETPRDLLEILQTAGGPAGFVFREDLTAPLEAGEAAPDRTRTLLEALDWHVQRHPDRRHILFYPGDEEPEPLTYADLDRRSRGVAAGLRALGLEPRQTVGLMLPTSLEYFAAFVGVLRAGGIPVPLYPPARRSQIEDHLLRQAGILRTAEARLLITFSEVLPLARLLRPQVPDLRRVVTVEELSSISGVASRDAAAPEVRGEDLAFLQFTSGSTGNPKGVMLTHGNLLANLRAIGRGVDLRPDDSAVSWLPLYHDMGLIGSWMAPLYFGVPLILMSPLSFLARPSRWLWAIHRHRATLSPAPNFAYELCTKKIEDAEIEGLDLSSWRIALNGAEPVSPAAIDRFIARFSRYGFDPRAMSPVYGLAECSLALAFPPLDRGPRVDAVERETFQSTGRAVPVPGDPHALRFVSCGLPLSGHEVRIVDDAGREVGERQEGRLEFKGPSATSGYYRNPEATQKLHRGEWLDSGDRAYIAAGEIYITGRVKDIIIRAGRNLYPQELEEAVGEIPGVRKGCVAVFGSADPATGTERLVILAETRERDEGALEKVRAAIQERAVDLLGSPADEVVLAPPQSVPKTSSGKIRRSASRELYESGKIGGRGASVGWQLARLAGAGARAQIGRWLRSAGDLLYAAWFWGAFSFVAPGLWLLLVVTPGLERRRRLARSIGRLLAFLTGTRLHGEGMEQAAGPGPRIVAANHQSYLDAFVLTTVLPPCFAFVAKRELERNPVARIFLRRLGTVFVERFEAGQGVEETNKVLDAVRRGDSIVIFPEGTFRRGAGLLPFRLGAFVVAAEAGVPVVPVVIRGTRSKMRGDDFFPRRGGAGVTALPPVHPEGTGWNAAVRLRDAVRAEILAACGEPEAG